MNKPYEEQISALLDGEVAESEMDMLMKRVRDDRQLADRVGRYAIIRDAMHRNLPPSPGDGIADRVAEAIELEPVLQRSVVASVSRRWTHAVGGMAVAASVAMLAIVVWPTQQTEVDTGSQPVAQSAPAGQPAASGSVAGAQTVATDEIRWDRLDPDVQARLSGYAVSRGDQPSSRQLGIVPRQVRSPGVSD
ncbi:sigma-E factor negative regulatory protein [Methylonatrum kenyense]|uniref:sigma-E factor negative regulatory protein n=1 Tax=Methylonatrum kenyense TaxID=455253 RepID=UPI0020BEE3F2|nr:sigma-E factor negative regulatory protein [Methylonatrum kenyense]MCK8514748.1 sigma-E factor negative regulatory protein [Methylonatrum kenyense]